MTLTFDLCLLLGFTALRHKCVHFCQLRKLHNDPDLTLNGVKVPVVDEAKFLGVIFDRKLSFIPHIKALKTKCLKALNLLKVLAHTDWGADRKVLLRLYRALIRSKLDYGCIVYGSARKSYLQMLDPIHHQGLRLALGAFRTSPIESLLVEANEPSLYLRREQLALNYACKVKANPNNPANDCLFDPKYETLYERKPKAIKPIGIRLKTSIEDAELELNTVREQKVPSIPPWTIKHPTVLLTLANDKKSSTNTLEFKSKFNELKSKYPSHTCVYTDGSKNDSKVGCASVSKFHKSKVRLPDNSSIFTAEVVAIDLALRFIASSTRRDFIIFSDSLSVLQSIKNKNFSNPLIQQILINHHKLLDSKNIIFCWLPSHVGISGNEEADQVAKSALNLTAAKIKLPFTDLKPLTRKNTSRKWQSSWNSTVNNKLHALKPNIGESALSYRSVRREEIVLARCRIGHTAVTHSYILRGEEQPECVFCQEPFTVKHFLIDCVDLALVRQRYFAADTMYQLFNSVCYDKIISFLKEANLFHQI